MNHQMIASVDLGSNSFRLQICFHHQGQLQVVDSIKEMVRMAAGLDERKRLDKATKQRVLSCLTRFGERLRHFEKSQVRVVATNTFRIMKNAASFVKQCEAVLGFPIEIIAGREEARLIYNGVVHTVPFEGRQTLVVDIGGGSTEFIIGRDQNPQITESLPLGCVLYSMRFFKNDKVSADSFRQAVNAARAEIQRISGALKQLSWDWAIGTSGTARAIRDILVMNTPNQDCITQDGMEQLAKRIISAGSTKKAKLEGLNSDRTEVFAGGLAVMMAIFEELNLKEMVISDAALRDGVFYDLIGRTLNQDLRDETIADYQQRYHVDIEQAKRIQDLALCLLDNLSGSMKDKIEDYTLWRSRLSRAVQLHEIGLSIAHTAYHKHSAYIIENADMAGFSRTEQQNLATLVLSHRGDLKKMEDSLNTPIWVMMILSFRLAVLLHRNRTEIRQPENMSLSYQIKKKILKLKLPQLWLEQNPLSTHALQLESAFWEKIGFHFMIEKGVISNKKGAIYSVLKIKNP